jgi:hypothetical protein
MYTHPHLHEYDPHSVMEDMEPHSPGDRYAELRTQLHNLYERVGIRRCLGSSKKRTRRSAADASVLNSQDRRSVHKWERNGGPLDVSRPQTPGEYSRPVSTTTDDWARACEMEQTVVNSPTVRTTSLGRSIPWNQQPQQVSAVEAANPRGWADMISVADQAQTWHPRSRPAVTIYRPARTRPGDAIRGVAAETRPSTVDTQQSISSSDSTQSPTTTIGATQPQTSRVSGVTSSISRDRILRASFIRL